MRTTDNRHFGLKPRRPQCGHFTVKISWTSWNVNQIFFEPIEVIVGTTFLMITIVCCKSVQNFAGSTVEETPYSRRFCEII